MKRHCICIENSKLISKIIPIPELIYKKNTSIIMINFNKNELGKIIKVNGGCFNWFKYQKEELLNKNINILMPSGISNVHNKILKKYFKTNKSFISNKLFKTISKNKDKKIFYVYMILKNFFDTNKNKLNIICFLEKIKKNYNYIFINKKGEVIDYDNKIGSLLFNKKYYNNIPIYFLSFDWFIIFGWISKKIIEIYDKEKLFFNDFLKLNCINYKKELVNKELYTQIKILSNDLIVNLLKNAKMSKKNIQYLNNYCEQNFKDIKKIGIKYKIKIQNIYSLKKKIYYIKIKKIFFEGDIEFLNLSDKDIINNLLNEFDAINEDLKNSDSDISDIFKNEKFCNNKNLNEENNLPEIWINKKIIIKSKKKLKTLQIENSDNKIKRLSIFYPNSIIKSQDILSKLESNISSSNSEFSNKNFINTKFKKENKFNNFLEVNDLKEKSKRIIKNVNNSEKIEINKQKENYEFKKNNIDNYFVNKKKDYELNKRKNLLNSIYNVCVNENKGIDIKFYCIKFKDFYQNYFIYNNDINASNINIFNNFIRYYKIKLEKDKLFQLCIELKKEYPTFNFDFNEIKNYEDTISTNKINFNNNQEYKIKQSISSTSCSSLDKNYVKLNLNKIKKLLPKSIKNIINITFWQTLFIFISLLVFLIIFTYIYYIIYLSFYYGNYSYEFFLNTSYMVNKIITFYSLNNKLNFNFDRDYNNFLNSKINIISEDKINDELFFKNIIGDQFNFNKRIQNIQIEFLNLKNNIKNNNFNIRNKEFESLKVIIDNYNFILKKLNFGLIFINFENTLIPFDYIFLIVNILNYIFYGWLFLIFIVKIYFNFNIFKEINNIINNIREISNTNKLFYLEDILSKTINNLKNLTLIKKEKIIKTQKYNNKNIINIMKNENLNKLDYSKIKINFSIKLTWLNHIIIFFLIILMYTLFLFQINFYNNYFQIWRNSKSILLNRDIFFLNVDTYLKTLYINKKYSYNLKLVDNNQNLKFEILKNENNKVQKVYSDLINSIRFSKISNNLFNNYINVNICENINLNRIFINNTNFLNYSCNINKINFNYDVYFSYSNIFKNFEEIYNNINLGNLGVNFYSNYNNNIIYLWKKTNEFYYNWIRENIYSWLVNYIIFNLLLLPFFIIIIIIIFYLDYNLILIHKKNVIHKLWKFILLFPLKIIKSNKLFLNIYKNLTKIN